MKILIKYNLYKPEFIKPNIYKLSHVDYLLIKRNCINRHTVNINTLTHTLINQGNSINYTRDNINDFINMYENNLKEDISNCIYEAILTDSIFKFIGTYNLSKPVFNIIIVQSSKYNIYFDINSTDIFITNNKNEPIGTIPINNVNLIKSLYRFISFNN